MLVEFRYREDFERVQLFIDYDLYKKPFCLMEPHEAMELVRMDVIRLKEMFGLGRAVIERSDGGAMVRFPDAKLTPQEMEAILFASPYVDRGFRYYSVEKGFQTLRTSPKRVVIENRRGERVGCRIEGSEPSVWEVIA